MSCVVLSACRTEQTPTPLTLTVLQVTTGQTLLITLNQGEVELIGSESEEIQIQGETVSPDQSNYKIISTMDQIQILANYEGSKIFEKPLSLRLHVRNHMKIKIDTENASITVRNYEGDIEASSIAGDISIQNVSGIITARSNRGDVEVEHSAGTVSIVGNYGLLTLDEVRGSIGASTIMGSISFYGPIGTDDIVRLETDHGAIGVRFSPDSSFSIRVRSTSGDVTCVPSGVVASLRTCDGIFNSVGGTLTVRTVSGPVRLEIAP